MLQVPGRSRTSKGAQQARVLSAFAPFILPGAGPALTTRPVDVLGLKLFSSALQNWMFLKSVYQCQKTENVYFKMNWGRQHDTEWTLSSGNSAAVPTEPLSTSKAGYRGDNWCEITLGVVKSQPVIPFHAGDRDWPGTSACFRLPGP